MILSPLPQHQRKRKFHLFHGELMEEDDADEPEDDVEELSDEEAEAGDEAPSEEPSKAE
jgi:hypothetical protein